MKRTKQNKQSKDKEPQKKHKEQIKMQRYTYFHTQKSYFLKQNGKSNMHRKDLLA